MYRGYPFVIEAGLAFGKGPDEATKPQQASVPLAEGEDQGNDTEQARVIRYANRVPLLYQQSACATFKAVLSTTSRMTSSPARWQALTRSRNSLRAASGPGCDA